MKSIRRIFRLILLFFHILSGVFVTLFLSVILRSDYSSSVYKKTKMWWFARTCHLLGLDVRVDGKPTEQTVLYVSNHISWIDIPLLGSLTPLHFLSKQGVRNWPIIGWLADKSGTLFISRGKQGAAASASKQIQDRLLEQQSILIFPEGTTTDGTDIRRFHGRLLSTAIETNTPISPIAIRYFSQNGQPNAHVAFIDGQSLLDSLWYVLGEKKTQVNVSFCPQLETNNKKRNVLATECETIVRATLSEY